MKKMKPQKSNKVMENLNVPNRQRVIVTLDQVNIGDVIYLSQKPDATPYQILDKGNPFVLIENMKSHFANMYRPTTIYKEI